MESLSNNNIKYMTDSQKIIYNIMNIKNDFAKIISENEKLKKENEELKIENATVRIQADELNKLRLENSKLMCDYGDAKNEIERLKEIIQKYEYSKSKFDEVCRKMFETTNELMKMKDDINKVNENKIMPPINSKPGIPMISSISQPSTITVPETMVLN